MDNLLLLGDSLQVLKDFPDNSVDAIVTDPPYGLSFMGKKWDYDVPSVELWREVLRVLKPGGHVLSFGGTRTYHRMVVNMEDAGFEIRDQVMWIYGSGFPKSQNVAKQIDKQAGVEPTVVGINPSSRPNSKMKGSRGFDGDLESEESAGEQMLTAATSDDAKLWQGWGTALKPANEPICLARKPLEKGLTVAENVLKYGTGAINVDASRIGTETRTYSLNGAIQGGNFGNKANQPASERDHVTATGRWPANILFDEAAAEMLDEQSGDKCGAAAPVKKKNTPKTTNLVNYKPHESVGDDGKSFRGDSGGASRFFYVAKASKRERNAGLGKDLLWENLDQNLMDRTVELSQRLRAILGGTTANLNAIEWNTILYGNTTSEPFQKALISTIKTASKQTIESKTLNVLANLSTKESILDAIRTITENGLSLVENVPDTSLPKLNITNDEMESLLGVVNAVLTTLSQIKGLGKTGNFHSTVKPIKLMEYLCKLITPPNGGVVLDPFMGSGTTGIAAKNLGFNFIGIEMNQEYLEIAKKRVG